MSHQCDVLLPDVCRAGGISETLRIARLADTFGVSWASHVSMSTPIHLAAGLHVGAATPNFYISEYPTGFSGSPIGDRLVKTPLVVDGGWVELSDEPGLGLDLDLQAIEELTQLSETRN
jgi:D-arabinonate dehydratase/D-galactarolactone cycloisomerase